MIYIAFGWGKMTVIDAAKIPLLFGSLMFLASAPAYSNPIAPVQASFKVVNTVNVGSSPSNGTGIGGIAIVGSTLYAATRDTYPGTVAMINTVTDKIVGRITVGNQPLAVALNNSGSRLYVGNWYGNTISVIDTSLNRVISTINNVGTGSAVNPPGPYALVLNPAGTFLYSANLYSGTVSVINTRTDQVTASIAVGSGPNAVAVSPSGRFLYTDGGGVIEVINTTNNQIVNTLKVGAEPYGIGFNTTGSTAYVSNWGDGTVSVINTSSQKIVSTINLGGGTGPEYMTLNPTGNLMYIAQETGAAVSVIDTSTNRLINTFAVGGSPVNLLFASSGQLYISNQVLGLQDVLITFPESQQQTAAALLAPSPTLGALPSAPVLTLPPIILPISSGELGFNALNTIQATIGSTINSVDISGQDHAHRPRPLSPQAVACIIGNDINMAGGVVCSREKNGDLNLESGTFLYSSNNPDKIVTKFGSILIAGNSSVLITKKDDCLAVCDLSDHGKGDVTIVLQGKSLHLQPGQEFVCAKQDAKFDNVNPFPQLGYRNLAAKPSGAGMSEYTCEFSISNALALTKIQSQTTGQDGKRQSAVFNSILKTAVCVQLATGNHGAYRQHQ